MWTVKVPGSLQADRGPIAILAACTSCLAALNELLCHFTKTPSTPTPPRPLGCFRTGIESGLSHRRMWAPGFSRGFAQLRPALHLELHSPVDSRLAPNSERWITSTPLPPPRAGPGLACYPWYCEDSV